MQAGTGTDPKQDYCSLSDELTIFGMQMAVVISGFTGALVLRYVLKVTG
ncbi:hypothetical protein ACLBWX_14470 [Methylobacterium sp. M6A4_1b]